MKVLFTSIKTNFSRKYDLRRKLIDMIPQITKVALKYEKIKNDNRTLVVVFLCPCQIKHPYLDIDNRILVSPFFGIENKRCYKVHTVNKTPPFRMPGKGNEAKDDDEFLRHFEETINKALSGK